MSSFHNPLSTFETTVFWKIFDIIFCADFCRKNMFASSNLYSIVALKQDDSAQFHEKILEYFSIKITFLISENGKYPKNNSVKLIHFISRVFFENV